MDANDSTRWHLDGGCFTHLSAGQLGGGVVEAKRSGDGRYGTVLPVSSVDYRLTRPTKARIVVEEFECGANITIIDDYGNRFPIVMDGRNDEWMAEFKRSAIANNLLIEQGRGGE